MVKLLGILLLLIPQIGCGQTFVHNSDRAEAMSREEFFTTLWTPEKAIYRIRLFIPEEEQTIVEEINVPVIAVKQDSMEVNVMRDPIVPDINIYPNIMPDTNIINEPFYKDPFTEAPPATEMIATEELKESPVKIKPKPQPVLMKEYIKTLEIKHGTMNILALKDTTYWIVVNGDTTASKIIKPGINKEWECCWLVYEWYIEMKVEDYFEIWHNDRIRDFELGDYIVARSQFFSELPAGEKLPDYYKGIFMIVEKTK